MIEVCMAPGVVYAAPVFGFPTTCSVRASIITFERTTDERLELGLDPQAFEIYKAKLKIVLNVDEDQLCRERYSIDREVEATYPLESYAKQPIRRGQVVQADISMAGDDLNFALVLQNVVIIDGGAPTAAVDVSGVSALSLSAIEQGYADEVKNVLFDVEKNEYEVVGYQKVKLFAFIPVHMKIRMLVQGDSGQVTSLKRSWWAFLTKK